MLDCVMIALIAASLVAAAASFWTGVSVGCNRHMLNVFRRIGIFSSVAASFGYSCLILIWWSQRGWVYMPPLEAIGWMVNHLMAFLALNLYHREVLRNLGFTSFKDSRHNAAVAYRLRNTHGGLCHS